MSIISRNVKCFVSCPSNTQAGVTTKELLLTYLVFIIILLINESGILYLTDAFLREILNRYRPYSVYS